METEHHTHTHTHNTHTHTHTHTTHTQKGWHHCKPIHHWCYCPMCSTGCVHCLQSTSLTTHTHTLTPTHTSLTTHTRHSPHTSLTTHTLTHTHTHTHTTHTHTPHSVCAASQSSLTAALLLHMQYTTFSSDLSNQSESHILLLHRK